MLLLLRELATLASAAWICGRLAGVALLLVLVLLLVLLLLEAGVPAAAVAVAVSRWHSRSRLAAVVAVAQAMDAKPAPSVSPCAELGKQPMWWRWTRALLQLLLLVLKAVGCWWPTQQALVPWAAGARAWAAVALLATPTLTLLMPATH
mgnify:CR=1 FL=1